MRIGQVAEQAGVGVETLRYYERRGLLSMPRRRDSGYREFDADAVARVRFIRRAQDLGFTLQEIGGLLALWQDSLTSCDLVQQRAGEAMGRIEHKIAELQRMRDALGQYVRACSRSSALAECPLLRALSNVTG